MKTLSLPYFQYFRYLLALIWCCVVGVETSAQVFQNTLTLPSTDEYCAGLASDATSGFYISVGNTNSGGTNRVLLTKYNSATGNVMWTRTVNQPGAATTWYATDIQSTHASPVTQPANGATAVTSPANAAVIAVPNNNSAYYISGYTFTTTCAGVTVRRMVLYKVDNNGNVLWTRSNFVGGCTYDEIGVSVETAPNGDVFIVGNARNVSNNRSHVSVARLRSNGNLIWQNRYLTSNTASFTYVPRQSITTNEAVVTTTGVSGDATGIAVTGEFRNTTVATSVLRGFVMRIASNGAEMWRVGHFLSGSTVSSGQDVIIDPVSRNFTVVGHVGTSTSFRTLFWQVTSLGGHVLSQIYNQPQQAVHYAQSIVPSRTVGNFAVAGAVTIPTASGGVGTDTYLTELNATGTPLWFRYYTRTTPRYAATESVVASPTGYYITTNAASTNTNTDGHVISTDALGMLPGATPDNCVERTNELVKQVTGDTQIQTKAQTATTTVATITTASATVVPTEDICKPNPCPTCDSFTVSIGDCIQDPTTGMSVRPVSFGLNCTIPTTVTSNMTWDFGDGSTPYTGPLASVIHNYAPGTYTVCAYGTFTVNGIICPFQICQTIVVPPCPLPCPECTSFSYTTACVQGPAGNLIPQATFTLNCIPAANIVSGTIWWDFGDGNTGNYPYNTVTHNYSAPGTYTVCAHAVQLVLDNGQVCELDYIICQTVVIPPCPSPCPTCNNFTTVIGDCQQATPGTATSAWYRQVGFSLNCPVPAGSSIVMNWDFGDGSPIATYNTWLSPVHNYAPGTYNVCVWGVITLADGTQCPFDYCQTVTVPPCQNPCPNCNSFTPHIGDCQQTATGAWYRQVGFSLDCTVPAGSSIVMNWNFGDGSPTVTYNSWVSPVHNYTTFGTFNVCVWGVITLADGTQCPFDYCQTVTIPPCQSLCPTCNSFTAYMGNCQQTATGAWYRQVGFSLNCPIPTGSSINMTWNFGDGSPTVNYTNWVSPVHNYVPGTYTVCVWGAIILADGTQCPFEYCQTITVTACPDTPCPSCTSLNYQVSCQQVVGATTLVPVATFGLNCQFPTGTTYQSTWTYGDGTSQTVTTPTTTHVYPSTGGTYTVCVNGAAILPNGIVCQYSICEHVIVPACLNNPCPTCVVNTQTSCCFSSTGSIVYYGTFNLTCPFSSTVSVAWSVNGVPAGNTPANTSVNYQFPGTGTYHVCAVVTNPTTGQVCDYCTTVEVTPNSCPSPVPLCVNIISTNKSEQVAANNSLNVSPNPFYGETTIVYNLEKASQATIQVYNVTGQMVATVVDNQQHDAGAYMVTFDGSRLPSGTYFCNITTSDGFSQTQRIVIMR
ncbi:MAG: PKD domain-containing protein [Chitinophagales bacterium]|nr:PKD domain-containing protein [Chitinophagales bacterium]